MDPGRRAMIEGWKASGGRDITSPRRDPTARISKPYKSNPSKQAKDASGPASYLSQDEQSRRFVADEDKFVLKQSKKKADIRVREHRAKPIDFLAFNLRWIDADRDIFDDDDADAELNIPNPDDVLQRLTEAQLKDLDEEIISYQTLETNARNRDYWTALLALCTDLRKRMALQGSEGRAVSSVAADIDKILRPKTYEQLDALEQQIKAKLASNKPIDTDYWEELLKSLRIWKSKAKLQTIYESIKQARIDVLKHRDSGIVENLEPMQPAVTEAEPQVSAGPGENPLPVLPTAHSSKAPPGTERFAQTASEDFSLATKALYEREVARGVSENEEVFAAEEEAPTTAPRPQWADKYRPRKPRYFNRVQMGYEWNKYNQTHYDHDNPPPKVVQGYKFNIFYPDLIERTKAPTFKISREGGRRRGESFAPAGEADTCLIRFIAGPPYEDIAFRIVDREWDYSAKKERGFRSSFDKGILQLHFQFKKIYYRK